MTFLYEAAAASRQYLFYGPAAERMKNGCLCNNIYMLEYMVSTARFVSGAIDSNLSIALSVIFLNSATCSRISFANLLIAMPLATILPIPLEVK